MALNIRIVRESHADQGVIAASSEARPVTALRNAQRGAVWRSDSPAEQMLQGDFGASRVTTAITLWRHNLTAGATWRARLWSGENQTGDLLYDSGTVAPIQPKSLGDLEWGVDPLGASLFTGWKSSFSTLWFGAVSARSWRVDLDDPDNTDGFIQATRLMIGSHISARYNFSYGLTLQWRDRTEQQRTDAGSMRVIEREPYRQMRLALEFLRSDERPTWLDIGRRIGRRENVFVSAYPERGTALERDHAFLARLTDDIGHTHPNALSWASELVFEEI